MPPKVAQWIKEQEEQNIFKEFEELGYKVIDYRNIDSVIYFNFINSYKKIIIWFDRTYSITNYDYFSLQEHQLLHRLFEIWGWFE